MLVLAVTTLVFVGTLGAVTTMPLDTVALIVIGGPAGVGSSMLVVHLRHSGTLGARCPRPSCAS